MTVNDGTPGSPTPGNEPGSQPGNQQLGARLRRIEGQIRGIARMLESGRSCEDVVTQLMAVRAGIDTVGAQVLDAHLCQCIDESRDPREQVDSLREAMRLWWKFAPASGGLGPAADAEGASSPLPVEPE